MSIPLDNKTWLVSRVTPVNATRSVDSVGRLPDKGPAGTFGRMLEELMTNSAGQTPGGTGSDRPLNREQLLQLIQWMNIQMTRRLLQSVGGDDWTTSPRWKIDGMMSVMGGGETAAQEDPTTPIAAKTKTPENPLPEIEYIPPTVSAPLSLNRYDDLIRKAAATHDVDPDLIRSVIQVESGFNASARSPKGAMGLMQLMPGTAQDLGVANPYDPEENIMGGTRYLKKLLTRYDGNVSLALAAYNWGMGNLENRPGRMPEETRNYISRITGLYQSQSESMT
jgi:hypothetical protein